MADKPPGASTQGPPPNFFDPKPLANYESTILGVTITLLSCCWLAIVTRLWTRLLITKTPGCDDLFIVLALLMISMGTVAFCVGTRYGMGQHIYLIDPGNISRFLICFYLDAASYNCSTALIKISLLFQYLRVFERSTWTYRLTQLLLIAIALWGCVFGFLAWFPCLPDPSAFWRMKPRGCYAAGSSNTSTVIKWIEAHAGSNVVWDIAVLALAFRLQFTKDVPTTKMGMAVLLFMGIISCTAAMWRLAEIVKSKAGIRDDLSWNVAGPTLLSFCEIYIACLTASTPFFWPIITEQINKIFVKYEFNVSSESRYHDDDVELAPTRSAASREDVGSVESRSGHHYLDEGPKSSNYPDYVKDQINPFVQEFRTEAVVQTGTIGTKNKKGKFVAFKNPA